MHYVGENTGFFKFKNVKIQLANERFSTEHFHLYFAFLPFFLEKITAGRAQTATWSARWNARNVRTRFHTRKPLQMN